MPSYLIELEGKKVRVDSPTELTPEQAEQEARVALGQPAGESSALGAAGRGMLSGLLPTAASLPLIGAGIKAGASLGTMAAPFLGPAAPAAPFIGGTLGAIGGGVIGGAGGQLLQENLLKLLPEATGQAIRQQLEADVAAHPIATQVGQVAAGLPFFKFTPSNFLKLPGAIGQAAKSIATKTPIPANVSNLLQNQAALAAMGAGSSLGHSLLSGQPVSPLDMLKEAVLNQVWGNPRVGAQALMNFGGAFVPQRKTPIKAPVGEKQPVAPSGEVSAEAITSKPEEQLLLGLFPKLEPKYETVGYIGSRPLLQGLLPMEIPPARPPAPLVPAQTKERDLFAPAKKMRRDKKILHQQEFPFGLVGQEELPFPDLSRTKVEISPKGKITITQAPPPKEKKVLWGNRFRELLRARKAIHVQELVDLGMPDDGEIADRLGLILEQRGYDYNPETDTYFPKTPKPKPVRVKGARPPTKAEIEAAIEANKKPIRRRQMAGWTAEEQALALQRYSQFPESKKVPFTKLPPEKMEAFLKLARIELGRRAEAAKKEAEVKDISRQIAERRARQAKREGKKPPPPEELGGEGAEKPEGKPPPDPFAEELGDLLLGKQRPKKPKGEQPKGKEEPKGKKLKEEPKGKELGGGQAAALETKLPDYSKLSEQVRYAVAKVKRLALDTAEEFNSLVKSKRPNKAKLKSLADEYNLAVEKVEQAHKIAFNPTLPDGKKVLEIGKVFDPQGVVEFKRDVLTRKFADPVRDEKALKGNFRYFDYGGKEKLTQDVSKKKVPLTEQEKRLEAALKKTENVNVRALSEVERSGAGTLLQVIKDSVKGSEHRYMARDFLNMAEDVFYGKKNKEGERTGDPRSLDEKWDAVWKAAHSDRFILLFPEFAKYNTHVPLEKFMRDVLVQRLRAGRVEKSQGRALPSIEEILQELNPFRGLPSGKALLTHPGPVVPKSAKHLIRVRDFYPQYMPQRLINFIFDSAVKLGLPDKDIPNILGRMARIVAEAPVVPELRAKAAKIAPILKEIREQMEPVLEAFAKDIRKRFDERFPMFKGRSQIYLRELLDVKALGKQQEIVLLKTLIKAGHGDIPINIANFADTSIHTLRGLGFDEEATGYYTSKEHVATVVLHYNTDLVRTGLHEAIHHIASRAYKKGSADLFRGRASTEATFAKEIDRQYAVAMSSWKKANTSGLLPYWLTDEQEYISGMLTTKEAQEFALSVPDPVAGKVKPITLFKSFLSALRSALGIREIKGGSVNSLMESFLRTFEGNLETFESTRRMSAGEYQKTVFGIDLGSPKFYSRPESDIRTPINRVEEELKEVKIKRDKGSLLPFRVWINFAETVWKGTPVERHVTDVLEGRFRAVARTETEKLRFDAILENLNDEQIVELARGLKTNSIKEGSPLYKPALAIKAYLEQVRYEISNKKVKDVLERFQSGPMKEAIEALHNGESVESVLGKRNWTSDQVEAIKTAEQDLTDAMTWGIDDYMIQQEIGSYRLEVIKRDAEEPYLVKVAIGRNIAEAKAKAAKYLQENPDVKGEDITITNEFEPKTTSAVTWMAEKIAQKSDADMTEILKGIKRAGVRIQYKSKGVSTPLLKHRKGILKGEENLRELLPYYAKQANRYLHLDGPLRKAWKAMMSLPENERAAYERFLNIAAGKKGTGDILVDSLLARIGVDSEPMLYSRTLSKVREGVSMLKLGYRPVAALVNRGFGIMNNLSSFSKEGISSGLKIYREAIAYSKTKEFENLWDENKDMLGIHHTFATEGPLSKSLLNPLGLFTRVEMPNRKESFAGHYLMAMKAGLKGEDATRWARQATRATQFVYDVAALPQAFYSPTARVGLQFKSALIGQMELLSSFNKQQKMAWLAQFLIMGGPAALMVFLQSVPVLGSIGFLREAEKEMTKNPITRGLPGVIGLDVSTALAPQLPKSVQEILGPFLGDLAKLYTSVLEPKISGQEVSRKDFLDWLTGLSPLAHSWSKLVESLSKGYLTNRRNQMGYRPNTKEKVLLALGARPAGMVLEDAKKRYIREEEIIFRKSKQKVLDAYLDAVEARDFGKMAEMRNRLREYYITPSAVVEGLRARKTPESLRLFLRLPQLHRTRYLDLNLSDEEL